MIYLKKNSKKIKIILTMFFILNFSQSHSSHGTSLLNVGHLPTIKEGKPLKSPTPQKKNHPGILKIKSTYVYPQEHRPSIYDYIHKKEYTLSVWTENFNPQGQSQEKIDHILSSYYFWYIVKKNKGINTEIILDRLAHGSQPFSTPLEIHVFRALQANTPGYVATYEQVKDIVKNKPY